jgi:hypothetical protein
LRSNPQGFHRSIGEISVIFRYLLAPRQYSARASRQTSGGAARRDEYACASCVFHERRRLYGKTPM